MDFKKLGLLLIVSLLLFGAVSAEKNANDFKIDNAYNNQQTGSYFALNLNANQDSGITVYKEFAVDDDSDEPFDYLIHDNGRDYLTPDDDFKVDKNSDNTVKFIDYDHAQHGVAEVIDVDGQHFIVVAWAKDSSSVSDADLTALLNQFNKDNNVKAIAF